MIVRFLFYIVLTSTVSLSGCGYNVTPLTKYDKKSANLQKNAVVVIGAKNFSFMDIARYTGPVNLKTQRAPSKPSVTTKQQQKQEVVTADPNNQNYQGERYDLTRLFKKKDANSSDQQSPESTQQTETKSEPQEITPAAKTEPAIKEYRIHKQSSFFSMYSYAKCIYTLEPGIYYLGFAFYDPNLDDNPNTDTAFTRLPGVDQNGVVQYGGFEVKAGQVLYIGDINFNWVDQYDKDFITITGDINQVRQDLIAGGENQLAAKIVQAKFYLVGSRIIASHEGNSYELTSQ